MNIIFRQQEEAKKKDEKRDHIVSEDVGAGCVSEHVVISSSTRNETQDDSYKSCDSQEAEPRVGEFMPKIHYSTVFIIITCLLKHSTMRK